MSEMVKFKDWYKAKYGAYPGEAHEQQSVVLARLADALAEWADMHAEHTKKSPT